MGEQEQPTMEQSKRSEAAPREEGVVPEGSVGTGKEEKVLVVTELSAPESPQTRPRGDAPALCALSSSWRMPDFPP